MERTTLFLSLAIILISLLILPLMVTGLLYEKFFGHRIDTRTHALVPSFQDFPELKRKPIEITSDREQLLRGFIYSKQAESVHLGLVIIAPGYR